MDRGCNNITTFFLFFLTPPLLEITTFFKKKYYRKHEYSPEISQIYKIWMYNDPHTIVKTKWIFVHHHLILDMDIKEYFSLYFLLLSLKRQRRKTDIRHFMVEYEYLVVCRILTIGDKTRKLQPFENILFPRGLIWCKNSWWFCMIGDLLSATKIKDIVKKRKIII